MIVEVQLDAAFSVHHEAERFLRQLGFEVIRQGRVEPSELPIQVKSQPAPSHALTGGELKEPGEELIRRAPLHQWSELNTIQICRRLRRAFTPASFDVCRERFRAPDA